MASNTLFMVQQINNKQFIVNLQAHTCTCGHYQENNIPCGHVLSSIHHMGQSAHTYISDFFSIATLKNTYQSNFNPVILANLDSFTQNPQPAPAPCLSPTKLRAKAGQPKIVRATHQSFRARIVRARTQIALIDSAEMPVGTQKCQNCGEPGHNRRTCQSPRLELLL